ncbi:MAG: hypothetical protein DRJ51_04300 [Thermoprotei archaeon]|nr:MAG: hypothetical protein DRJ36_03265 [Thermoprotei archaeon]RLE81187.1 MAG: hypothetical protein DRJ51_04300 [Thermoprotei archaeon]RLF01853.1 MAG: hypothetical protein DRJ59_05150 [Thermoprotei archaeon]
MSVKLIKEPLTEEDVRRLEDFRNMLEEIIETVDLLLNPEALEGLAEAEKDAEEGRIRDWDESMKDSRGKVFL